MKRYKLKDLKKGTWFTLKEIEEPKMNQVWIKEDYCRLVKKYIASNYSDINRERLLKGDTEVYVDFIF